MTSAEIKAVVDGNFSSEWSPNMPCDVAAYRAQLETAYQVALLNEAFGFFVDMAISHNPQIRVMVEGGDWPLSVDQVRK